MSAKPPTRCSPNPRAPHESPDSIPAPEPARLAVLISGRGRTLANLADRIDEGRLSARIVLVISGGPCPGVRIARERGFETLVMPGDLDAQRFEQILDAHRVDWVCLGGYLRLLPIPARYRGRIVNIHPALLPRHGGPGMYGSRVHEAVIAAGDRESGCTVHLCDETYDTGAIVLQKRCPVLPDDTPERLARRVFDLECQAYPEALELLIQTDGSRFDRAGPDNSVGSRR